jgi:hypothetical protein
MHMRPRVFWEVKAPFSVISAIEGGRFSAIRTGRLYPQEYPDTQFYRPSRPRAHAIVGCHGTNSTVTLSGIDPGTFQLVAQCLNHYAAPGPSITYNVR